MIHEIADISHIIYQGRKIINITQVIQKNIFKRVSKYFFALCKYNQITKATKKNTSYLNQRKLEIFGCQKGKKIYKKDIIAKVVIVQSK